MKYTENTNREAFVKKLESQNILTIIKKIQQFPWKDYVYEGPCTLMTTNDDEEVKFETKQIRATASSSPYYILGGAAYFVYKTHYRDLLKYMDPTGDIDIRIDLPKIDSVEGDKSLGKLSEYFRSTSKTKPDIWGNYELNELTLHYLHWIFDLLVESVNIGTNDLEVYDYIGDNVIHHQHKEGKVHYVIVQEQHMIKVQIECKVRGMQKPDHLLEMIMVSSNNFREGLDSRNLLKKRYYDFHGYMIQTFDHMLDDNISAMNDRFELLHQPSTQHKLYNHVARIRYLNYIFPSLYKNLDKDHTSISEMSDTVKREMSDTVKSKMSDDLKRMINDVKSKMIDAVKSLLYFVWNNRFKMYHYNYESQLTNKEFMVSMIGNFYKEVKKNPGNKSFIVIDLVNGYKRIVLKRTKDLLDMYKPFFDSSNSFTLKTKPSRVKSFTKKRKKSTLKMKHRSI
jgi:hypothetical protein